MQASPHPLIALINKITDPRRAALLAIYQRYQHLFHIAPGASHNHQTWPGGYADHVADTLLISNAYAEVDRRLTSTVGAELGYSPDSAVIALFLHDIEKPFKYGPAEDSDCQHWQQRYNALKNWEMVKHEIVEALCHDYGLLLTNDEINALRYTHGEGADYSGKARTQSPLAAHVHICDTASARKFPHLHLTKPQDVAA